MRMTFVTLSAVASLTFALPLTIESRAESPLATATVKMKEATKLRRAGGAASNFKADVPTRRDTYPAGCTHGNDNVDRCTQFCIESASGPMCVPSEACYYKGEQVAC